MKKWLIFLINIIRIQNNCQRSEYNLAKKIDEFLKSKGLELGKDIKPSVVNYSDVQQGNANKTVEKEEENINKKMRSSEKRPMKSQNLLCRKD